MNRGDLWLSRSKHPKPSDWLKNLRGERAKSAETVVQVALQERLARLRTPEEEAERRARVYALVHELAGYFQEALGGDYVDHGELLYGEDGLPR